VKSRARLLLIAVVCALSSSCAMPFYWQAIGGQLELLRKRTPIEELLADPDLDPELRLSLGAVAEIRRFAVRELALPDNDSYTSYVDLDRPYVVWNVVAAEEFATKPKRWCFPFAGCVAYRGFFDREAAEAFRERLDEDGYDTFSGGSTAYSTLGYFSDPVLSTMLGSGEQYIASLLFHELAHQRLYIKDDSEFNEAFATAIEEYGTELWLRRHADALAIERYRSRLDNRAAFAGLVADQQRRLKSIYASAASPEAKREAKRQAFATMRADYARLKEETSGLNYDSWFDQPLNNATLAAVATYRRWVPALRSRLDALGDEGFYAEMDGLADLSVDGRRTQLARWLETTSTGEVVTRAQFTAPTLEVARHDGRQRVRSDAERR
jgi:predicted aminopeptidase